MAQPTCIYIYIHIHIYAYAYIHIYIYIYMLKGCGKGIVFGDSNLLYADDLVLLAGNAEDLQVLLRSLQERVRYGMYLLTYKISNYSLEQALRKRVKTHVMPLYGVGAALSHRLDNSTERPITYASRTLTPAERKCPVRQGGTEHCLRGEIFPPVPQWSPIHYHL